MTKLAKKFEEWRTALLAEDVNSISNILCQLYWDSAVAHSLDGIMKSESILRAPLINHFVVRHYFQVQALRIRRLVDKSSDVYSLGLILQQLKDCRHLITRSALLELRQVEPDLTLAENEEQAWNSSHKGEVRMVTGLSHWAISMLFMLSLIRCVALNQTERSERSL